MKERVEKRVEYCKHKKLNNKIHFVTIAVSHAELFSQHTNSIKKPHAKKGRFN